MSGLVPAGLRQVTDVPDACTLVQASRPTQLLTDQVLRELCDLAPEGAEVFDQVGAEAIRSALTDAAVLGRDVLGHDEIVPYLGRDLRHTHLEKANRLLEDTDAALSLLGYALFETMDPQEKEQNLTFRRLVDFQATSSLQVLYLPRRIDAVRSLRRVATTHSNTETATHLQDMLDVLDSTRNANPAERELREDVWKAMLAASELPARDLDGHVNRTRMEELFGFFPHVRTLASYPGLRQCIRGAIGSGRPKGSTAQPVPVSDEVTLADGLRVILAHVEDHGRMPRHQEVDAELVRAIEARLGSLTFNEWCDQLAGAHGISRRKRSDNELALDEMVKRIYDADVISRHEEWTDEDVFDAGYRIDTRWELIDGDRRLSLFAEADGQGHFTQVHNWDLETARRNDRSKARQLRDHILDLREQGDDGMLVAVHHRCVTGNRNERIDDDVLRHAIDLARQEGAWWLYVRPAGNRDQRSYPGRQGRPRRLRSEELDGNVEAFVLTW